MRRGILLVICLALLMCGGIAAAERSEQVGESARQGFAEILDLWRSEDYGRLYARLEHPQDMGWDYFAARIVYGSRVPACCWEQLQDVQTTVLGPDRVLIHAKVGFEIEGIGTRFVTRAFPLHREGGVWKLPLQLVLELSDINMQRVPREIYERQP